MAAHEEVERFIRSAFPSVWSLEVLLLLKRDPRAWHQSEIVSTLRASELIVSQSLQALSAGGLAAVDAGGRALYAPASEDAAHLVEAAEALYLRSPDAVRRLIVASTGSLSAFADAFRIRKD